MSEHPIEGLMVTAMNSIQDMIDVNTIVGEPIETSNNIIIIPISKVSFGFAAGGSEFKGETIDEYTKKDKDESIQYRLPFGGGSGAGVTINPVAFLIVQQDSVKLLPVNHTSCVDKLLDYVPELIDKTNNMLNNCIKSKNDETQKIIQQMQRINCAKEQKNENKREQEHEIMEQERKEQRTRKKDIREQDKRKKDIIDNQSVKEKQEQLDDDEMYEFEYDE